MWPRRKTLFQAIDLDDPGLISECIRSGAPHDAPDPSHRQDGRYAHSKSALPLHYAVHLHHYNAVGALLAEGADPNRYCDAYLRTSGPPLHVTASGPLTPLQPGIPAVALLLRHRADPNSANEWGETAVDLLLNNVENVYLRSEIAPPTEVLAVLVRLLQAGGRPKSMFLLGSKLQAYLDLASRHAGLR